MKDKINNILLDMQNNKLDVGEASSKLEELYNGVLNEVEKVKKPFLLPIIDTSRLMEMCGNYIDSLWGDDDHNDEDWDHPIYETAMEILFGDDIFDKINKRLDEL